MRATEPSRRRSGVPYIGAGRSHFRPRPLRDLRFAAMAGQELTEADRRTLWEHFADVHSKSQESFDSSVRTLAAAGVAVTASLGTALDGLGQTGLVAVVAFLGSLSFNVSSYMTAQWDMHARLDNLRDPPYEGIEGSRWTSWTQRLNLLAGVALILGGVLLAAFVASTA